MQLIVKNFKKVYGTSKQLTALLLDDNNNPILDTGITFTINGVSYTRVTDNNGVARLKINLNIGTYTCTVQCIPLKKTITVSVVEKFNVALVVNPLTKIYGTPASLKATLYGEDIEPLAGRKIQFTIHGVTYNRTTDSTGSASLNINLHPGVYPCTIYFPGDSEYGASTSGVDVTVKSDTRVDGFDVTKKYSDAGFFQCAVYDIFGRLNPCTVDIRVHGVTYTRSTDNEGLIRLNIRLQPGDYPITVKYHGDATHNPSSGEWMVHVRPDIDTITTQTPEGYTIPSNNRGFMESHVYVWYYPAEKNQKTSGNNVADLNGAINDYAGDLRFTNYEIIETDGRVKTAKFTTPHYLDLTRGPHWVYITSPYDENFGGKILKDDYDKSTGLYTYQCQDGRRQYLSKRKLSIPEGTAKVYDILEVLLALPQWNKKGPVQIPLKEEWRKLPYVSRWLAGLPPINAFDDMKLSLGIKGNNPLKQTTASILAYDSLIDQITNLARNGQYPVDIYFTPDGVCHIEPVNLDKWLNQGIRLVHSDLASIKYGFDTTNIITGVSLKDARDSSASYFYDEWSELGAFFGTNFGIVDPVTTTTTDTNTNSNVSTNTVSSGLMSGKKTFDVGQDNGIVPHYKNTLINKLRAKGHTVNDLGVGPSVVQNNGKRSSSKGHIAIYICNGICPGTHADFLAGMKQGYYNYDHAIFTWVRGDIEMSRMQSRAWDDNFSGSMIDTSISRHEFFVRNKDRMSYVNLWPEGNNSVPLSMSDWEKQCDAIVNGQFSNNSNASVSVSNTTSNTTSTTVRDDLSTYNKALEAMSNGIRDLLSFEIKLPLNNPVFKGLHTNMMLWTELPSDFKLINLEKIFKILPTYKVNRGVPYQENRWYVEKKVTKCDSNGLFATLTLNPFPSSYSVYSNAVKQYAEAYDQAFKQKNTTENNTSTTTTNAGSAEQIFKEVASICEKYSYSLGRGVSSYSAMKKAGHGDCWAFAELVYDELKSRGINAVIWQYATTEASNHRSAGYQASDGTWKDFPYRTYVTNPKRCVNGGNNWYFNFSRPSGAYKLRTWTGGKSL